MADEDIRKKINPALYGRSVGGFLDGKGGLVVDPPVFGEIETGDVDGDEGDDPRSALSILEGHGWGWEEKARKLAEFIDEMGMENEFDDFIEGLTDEK